MTSRFRLVIAAIVTLMVGYFAGTALGDMRTGTIKVQQLEQRIQAQLADVPDGPATWIAFSADYTSSHGSESANGRFYRASDGSTRTEAASPNGKDVFVTIHNVTDQKDYFREPSGQWSVTDRSQRTAPLRRPLGGSKASLARVTDFGGAFEVYKKTQSTSTQVSWLARELNYFEIRTEYGSPDRAKWFESIQLKEPDRNLFRPPAGVEIHPAPKQSLRDAERQPHSPK